MKEKKKLRQQQQTIKEHKNLYSTKQAKRQKKKDCL